MSRRSRKGEGVSGSSRGKAARERTLEEPGGCVRQRDANERSEVSHASRLRTVRFGAPGRNEPAQPEGRGGVGEFEGQSRSRKNVGGTGRMRPATRRERA